MVNDSTETVPFIYKNDWYTCKPSRDSDLKHKTNLRQINLNTEEEMQAQTPTAN